MFRKTDHNMILFNSPQVVAYEEKTRNLPYRICRALYDSGARLERHIAIYHGNERRYCCKHCQKEFRKDNNKLLLELYCTGTDHKLLL